MRAAAWCCGVVALWANSIPTERAIAAAITEFHAHTTEPGQETVTSGLRTDFDQMPIYQPSSGRTWGVLRVPTWTGLVRGQMPIIDAGLPLAN